MLAFQTCANHFPVIATSTLSNYTQMLLAFSFTTNVSFTLSFTTFVNHHLCLSPPLSFTTFVFHHLCLSSPLSFATFVFHHLCLSPPLSITTFVFHHLCLSSPLSITTFSTRHLSPRHLSSPNSPLRLITISISSLRFSRNVRNC